eukprot:1161445-Pelagomonas_calceolata.AAC.17
MTVGGLFEPATQISVCKSKAAPRSLLFSEPYVENEGAIMAMFIQPDLTEDSFNALLLRCT